MNAKNALVEIDNQTIINKYTETQSITKTANAFGIKYHTVWRLLVEAGIHTPKDRTQELDNNSIQRIIGARKTGATLKESAAVVGTTTQKAVKALVTKNEHVIRSGITEAQIEIMLLNYYLGHNLDKIAKILNLPAPTVRYHLVRKGVYKDVRLFKVEGTTLEILTKEYNKHGSVEDAAKAAGVSLAAAYSNIKKNTMYIPKGRTLKNKDIEHIVTTFKACGSLSETCSITGRSRTAVQKYVKLYAPELV